MKARNIAAACLAAAVVALGGAALAIPAGATTLTCTGVANQTVPPFGCGGAELAYTARGTLDLAVLDGGNYWNSKVGFKTESVSDTSEDWTVFAVNGKVTGGPGGLGEYVAMYTPDGKIASFTQGTVSHTNAVPAPGDFTVGTNVYCLSVENLNNGPGHTLRWRTVLRNCNTDGTFEYGTNGAPQPTPSPTPSSSSFKCSAQTLNNCVSSSHANRYQVWSPVTGSKGLEMINLSLSNDHPHGFNKSNTPYVLDDSGFGGTGTWGLAFPENDGLNQQFSIIGCTEPITGLNTSYQLCP